MEGGGGGALRPAAGPPTIESRPAHGAQATRRPPGGAAMGFWEPLAPGRPGARAGADAALVALPACGACVPLSGAGAWGRTGPGTGPWPRG